MYKPPFDITSEMLHLISEISEQVGIINMRLGDNAPSPQLRKKSQIKTIHSSLAIEHNSLSLKQVTDIIDGKRVLGAPDEIQEVKNAIEAYRLMPELDAFKEKDLLKAHALMMKDLVKQAIMSLSLSIPLLMVMAVWGVSGKQCCSLAGRVSLHGYL